VHQCQAPCLKWFRRICASRTSVLFLTFLAVWSSISHVTYAQTFEQTPGTAIAIDLNALPAPYSQPSATNNPQIVAMPAVPQLRVPQGFTANIFAQDLSHARNLLVVPNGDVFVAESNAGRILLLRDADGDGRAELRITFASGYSRPYGLALANGYLYIADLIAVWRVFYTAGATAPGSARQQVTANGAIGDTQGHATRNVIFNPAQTKMYVAVGSRNNVAEESAPRATIQEFNADGSGQRTYASGLRNPVGLAFSPGTSDLYAVVNERDGLGDELVPDYLTKVVDGGFYGWPYSYMGSHQQPNFAPANTPQAQALIAQARVPDVPLRSHSAPLGVAFYNATRFPAAYRGGAFMALHGSWNAAQPRAYMVAYAPFNDGEPTGSYSVFASGFWTAGSGQARVFGRPAGVAVAADGALLIADDASQTIWRIAYAGGSLSFNSVNSTANPGDQSFLRFYNAGSQAGAITLTIRAAASGEVLTTWTSPSIPAHASPQFSLANIQSEASPSLVGTGHPAFTVDVRSTFTGYMQHVMWSVNSGVIENMTRCIGGPSPDGQTLINVHSSRLSSYPSYLRIFNGGVSAQAATLTLYNAATGAQIGAWTSTAIPVAAALDIPVFSIESGVSSLPSSLPNHYVMVLNGGFTGYLQQAVRNPTTSLSEMTDKCVLTAD